MPVPRQNPRLFLFKQDSLIGEVEAMLEDVQITNTVVVGRETVPGLVCLLWKTVQNCLVKMEKYFPIMLFMTFVYLHVAVPLPAARVFVPVHMHIQNTGVVLHGLDANQNVIVGKKDFGFIKHILGSK
jgi:hypothetical protein